jgi:hypothetical protein
MGYCVNSIGMKALGWVCVIVMSAAAIVPRLRTMHPHCRETCIKQLRTSEEGYMKTDALPEGRSSLQKVMLLATVVSGFAAAYLMYRRGESLGSIAKQTITNPVGSLVSEVKNSV